MLHLILDGILELIEDSIKILFNLFSGIFDFSLQKFANMFPVADQLYKMLRAIGLGLILAIAIFQLVKYFLGPLAKETEKPQVILLRAFFAVFLVYMAPYVLEQIFNITGLIFSDFAALNVTVGETTSEVGGAFVALGSAALAGIVSWISGIGAAGVLFGIILGIVLVIQFVQMMLEIVERYLMTILLIYSSPLAMSTFTSESTAQILKKWFSMFIAQCILLILSIWGVVLFMNVLAVSSSVNSGLGNPVLSMIFAYAIVKIVKRLDNYLQQVGLNAAGIGGMSILDSIASTAGSLERMTRGKDGKGIVRNAFDLKRHSGLYQGIAGAVAGRGNGNSAFRNFMAGSMNATGPTLTGVAGSVKRGVEKTKAFSSATDGFGVESFAAGVAAASAVKPTTYASFADASAARDERINADAERAKNNEARAKEQAALTGQKDNLRAAMSHYAYDKSASQAKTLGSECANAWRIMQGASPETIEESGLADSIKEAVQSDPYVARSMMTDIIEHGGGTIEGDLADAVYDSYAGNALEDYLDGDSARSDSTLTLGQNKTGTRDKIEYDTKYKAPDGQMFGLRAGNEYSSLVAQEKDGSPSTTKQGAYVTSSSLVNKYTSRPNSALNGTAMEPVFVSHKSLSARPKQNPRRP